MYVLLGISQTFLGDDITLHSLTVLQSYSESNSQHR